ncbi:MAG: penicillin-binding protein activator LpoB [Pseudomonadales bacterium]
MRMTVFHSPFAVIRIFLIIACMLLTSCAVNQTERKIEFDKEESWVLLPIINFSQTPQAGERAERIAETLLRSEGLKTLSHYPSLEDPNGLPILDEQKRFNSALAWAQDNDMRYGVTGSIEEWRYKSGLDGEPAVGVSLQIIDVGSGDVLWSGSGSRAGWSRESLSGTAHKVLEKLVAKIKLE